MVWLAVLIIEFGEYSSNFIILFLVSGNWKLISIPHNVRVARACVACIFAFWTCIFSTVALLFRHKNLLLNMCNFMIFLKAAPVNIIVGSHVWVEDPVLAWIDGEVFRIDGEEVHINRTDGKTVCIPSSFLHAFFKPYLRLNFFSIFKLTIMLIEKSSCLTFDVKEFD